MKNRFAVDENHQGTSLRNFIKQKYKIFTVKQIDALLQQNGCLLNRAIERFGSIKLNIGDQIEVFPEFLKEKKKDEVAILYQDEHLFIVNKPSSFPSSRPEFEKLFNQELFLVHRLDKQTSGVLVLAKTRAGEKAMEELFLKREVEKKYIAITHGKFSKLTGTIDKPIRLRKRYEGGVIYQTTPFGQESVTHWRRQQVSATETLLSVQPVTGRTHQIRIHLNSIGHSILGDPVYNDRPISPFVAPRLMLHAQRIAFNHPLLPKRIDVTAPIPPVFKQTIIKLFKRHKKCAD